MGTLLKLLLARLLAPLFAMVLAVALTGCEQHKQFSATDVTGADFGRDFALADSQGKFRHLADFKGKAVVVFFGYTQCPDVCPTTLSTMAQVMGLLGSDANRVQVLFVTVDPERDSAALLAEYVPAFHPSFLGLRGDATATQQTMQEFRVFAQKNPGKAPGQYSVDHTAQNYVFDPQGRLRLIVRHGSAAQPIADDLRRLLAGE
jgi:protein SCO1/2